ncbi:hypothetical protein OO015_12705 [Thermomicrobium sp. 4228-Ro]|uniref:hypothetical protein n=1 Tax=Thermomicrobium sp. 4228-Ro TaxID=2993937 RepID=UPI002249972C|nr:hypothetical protein [Thermomicrobium sp. 4228-Ro]MCX2728351.1 hypothetical protein [Thermomicrobium sp. 4228-Ro]
MSVESMARKLRRQAAKRINQRLKQPKHSIPQRYPFKYRQTERGRVPLTQDDAVAMLRWREAKRARQQQTPESTEKA